MAYDVLPPEVKTPEASEGIPAATCPAQVPHRAHGFRVMHRYPHEMPTPPAIVSPAPDQHRGINGLPVTRYGAQLADALVTSNAIKQCGGRENFIPLRPFAHGGITTYLTGFAAFDLVAHALLRRTPWARRMEVMQTASSIAGLTMDASSWCGNTHR